MAKAWASEFNNQLKPITDEQKEFHRKKSERFLFVEDKDGNCTCPICGERLKLGKTTHKQGVECPSCKEKLMVQHTWRASKSLELIKWMAIPQVINEHVVCLRYVLAHQYGANPMKVYEAARMYIDEFHVDPEYYCKSEHGWSRGKNPYFRPDNMMCHNRFECLYANMYTKNLFEELDKMDCFKYYSSKNEYDNTRIPSQLMYMVHSARLNEKLHKVGMNGLADEHMHYFLNHGDRCYRQNYRASSLIDMLKLDKPRYNTLKACPTVSMLFFLQENKGINLDNLKMVDYSISNFKTINDIVYKTSLSFKKVFEYTKDLNLWEYKHYLGLLETLGYDIKDKYYILPKDFRKADKKISDEYNARLVEEQRKRDEERMKKLSEKDGLIKKISDGLKKMPNLAEFLNGSNGLLVYIPESAKDLIEEGRSQHNCVGTYIDRIAEGKTLVFFVRRLNDPTAPFVDFEYCNGEVVQCRYDHNENVEDTEIIDFVNRFAEVLRAA